MRLDSDVDNADSQLHVEFYTYDEDGPWKGSAHVRIVTPGDKTNIIDRPARDSDKRRFQRQWLHYQRANSDHLIVGTPLSAWRQERPEELTDGQLQELTILKFLSVEQVAMASDTQVMRMGMGAMGLRVRARTYLSSKNAQVSGAALATAQARDRRAEGDGCAACGEPVCPGPEQAEEQARRLSAAQSKGRKWRTQLSCSWFSRSVMNSALSRPHAVATNTSQDIIQILALMNASGYELLAQA
jgi:hypothetical protein